METTKNGRLYTATLILAAAPVIFGVQLFAMLLLTRCEDLLRVAWYALIPCLASVLASAVCYAVMEWVGKWKMTKADAAKIQAFMWLVPVVLFGVFRAGFDVYSQYVMFVENASKSTVKNLTFKVDDYTTTIPALAPWQKVRRVYHFPNGNKMEFTATIDGKRVSGRLLPDMSCQTPGRGHLVFPEKQPFFFDSISRYDVIDD